MSKYKARKVEVDNIWFDSAKEAARYGQLKLLVRAGYIRELEIHVPLPLIVNGQKVCTYICDFRYFDKDDRRWIEDVKGMRSGAAYQMFRVKAKLFEALNPGLRITEI